MQHATQWGDWVEAIEAYQAAERAAGSPATTLATRRHHLEHMGRRIGVGPWALEPRTLVDWFGAQIWARETRRGRRNTLLSFYRWAVSAGMTDTNPAAALGRVKPAQPSPRPVPDRVYEAALRRADDRVALMIRLAAEAGLRRAEIAQVHSRDLFEDLEGWSLVVHGKGERTRVVPLTRRLALEVRSRPVGYLFPGDDCGHLSPRWVGRLVADALGEDWTMHKLRHRAGTKLYEATGGDVFVVQDLLGHASPATTRVYVRVTNGRLRRAVEAAAS